MVTDPLADMLIRIKNAALAGLPATSCPYSKYKLAVAEKLKQSGYLKSVAAKGRKGKRSIELQLVYDGRAPKIRHVELVSKPSRRLYHRVTQIKSVRQGFGLAVYSTPRGILTDKEARKAQVGGEILFKVW